MFGQYMTIYLKFLLLYCKVQQLDIPCIVSFIIYCGMACRYCCMFVGLLKCKIELEWGDTNKTICDMQYV